MGALSLGRPRPSNARPYAPHTCTMPEPSPLTHRSLSSVYCHNARRRHPLYRSLNSAGGSSCMTSGRLKRCACSVVWPSARNVSCINESATNAGTVGLEDASTQWRVYTGHGSIPEAGAQSQTFKSRLARVRWQVYRSHNDVFFLSSSSELCTEKAKPCSMCTRHTNT